MANTVFVVLASITTIVFLVGGAYAAGLLDEYIEALGVFAFKFKAKAEAKKMGLQGLQEGTDFLASDLKGNQQAKNVREGKGPIGGLKTDGEGVANGILGGADSCGDGLVGGLKSGGEGLTGKVF
ncbi:hypothetical protein BCIN_06g03900 [Botrytis cinerea B05.10]|uniref:Uncharacterized protein n=3 Tax=Botryotinia fuckeliana TaxID=40559 RepID=A0A384JKC0_BOTFB|nr:hypothetical protein BCIN_06g03900 [Botrytis cinerea B05.10]ATZ50922.1 hypothetical protein BCIN_06g03900 [Botrytis cinerea B05.10]EMR86387.1 hypothetical protein BcDW1_4951 [Botrytis cinerea BcDW1]CCD48173.1 hypothetical protein BofuT4_P111860.1 [Botrytis cinerea T4]